MRRAHLDFSYEEIVAICDAVGTLVPIGLTDDPLGALDRQVAELVVATARRSLLARSIMSIDEGAFVVHPAVADIFALIAAPALVVEMARHSGSRRAVSTYVADPHVSLCHHERPSGIHRFTAFDTAELVSTLLHDSGIEAMSSLDIDDDLGNGPPDAGAMDGDTLDAARSLALASDVPGATTLLGGRLASEHAARLARALAARTVEVTIAVIHRSGDTVLEGGQMRWLPDPDDSAWLLPFQRDTEPVALVSGQRLADTLCSYLPHELTISRSGTVGTAVQD